MVATSIAPQDPRRRASLEDLSGRAFGRWTVLDLSPERSSRGGTMWRCRCECGTTQTVLAKSLHQGSQSCGCLQRESARRTLTDLSGQRFGRLTVLAPSPSRSSSRGAKWECRCDCGTTKTILAKSLRQGLTQSCGCLQRDVIRKGLVELAGQQFGRWTVLGPSSERSASGGAMWECRCECGTERTVKALSLRQGASQSCGCLWRETMARVHTTHGKGTRRFGIDPTYQAWSAAKARCHPESPHAAYYADRGITMSREWAENFSAFLRDTGPCPPGKELDRIDNNRGYESGNCRWTIRAIQMRNTGRNHWITIDGETLCVQDWAKRMRISAGLICTRITKLGWSEERAVLTPPHLKYSRIQHYISTKKYS